MIIYPGFPRIVLVYTCYSSIIILYFFIKKIFFPASLLIVPPLIHKSIPVWIINFVSPFPKVKLGKECFQKISPDGLELKKRMEEGK